MCDGLTSDADNTNHRRHRQRHNICFHGNLVNSALSAAAAQIVQRRIAKQGAANETNKKIFAV